LHTLALPIETAIESASGESAVSQTTLHVRALGMLFDWRELCSGHVASLKQEMGKCILPTARYRCRSQRGLSFHAGAVDALLASPLQGSACQLQFCRSEERLRRVRRQRLCNYRVSSFLVD
jgi:hypothetical protein